MNFKIYPDDTVGHLILDYVAWAYELFEIEYEMPKDYEMPKELRASILQEINRICDLIRKEQE